MLSPKKQLEIEIYVARHLGLSNGRKRIFFVDNFSGHNCTLDMQTAAAAINTGIRHFPPNASDLIQLCDSFTIQKIKSICRRRWEAYQMDKIRSGHWKDCSGKVVSPVK